jgi:hypothetical protein
MNFGETRVDRKRDKQGASWDLILVQYQYNNCTTPHMRVGPSMSDPFSREGLLYSYCIGVVNLTFSLFLYVYGATRRT